MFTIVDFQDFVEQQLHHNRNKSLFYEGANGRVLLSPSKESKYIFNYVARDISYFLQSAYSNGTIRQLITYISDKTIKLFIEANQYLDFSFQDKFQLQKIYSKLMERVFTLSKQIEMTDAEIDELFYAHYKSLQLFLLHSNGSAICYKYKEKPHVFDVKCAEYSPEFQMELLNIELSTIKEPVLDIGCGKQANLVHYLKKNGVEAYGMDRDVQTTNDVGKMNWLESSFVPNAWGTIISHMAFSNHFKHHHLRADGNVEKYAKTYMNILHSLKREGRFIYAPSLSFMEDVLISSTDGYHVETNELCTQVMRVF
ncbi:class I SAM-dependent methyltransferase [Pseudogracilibacillus auburnensis]|uniref:Methyltransferase family protein n=1 Tax=Pseudogracilibacillus auburnensis TaxID=1494959 RepID=A0A2V3VXF7_9BACI|nr:class I SAM-dependent methyltransferase [Pseudogracilibacillus auburnensis]PXW85368.1 hypothetical protein DFR56_111136 [Pseudogracilibacillus auburnensis]